VSEWTDKQYRYRYTGEIISKVVGVTKEPGYPRLAYLMIDAQVPCALNTSLDSDEASLANPDGVFQHILRYDGERFAGVLIRDPRNPFDVNAIEVHVPMLECRVGFLPMRLAQRVAPQLDTGERFIVQVWAVPNVEREEFPGIRVLLTPVEEVADAVQA
jgi:hypothetical protein